MAITLQKSADGKSFSILPAGSAKPVVYTSGAYTFIPNDDGTCSLKKDSNGELLFQSKKLSELINGDTSQPFADLDAVQLYIVTNFFRNATGGGGGGGGTTDPTKVALTDVYNALDRTTSGKVLDARQGKVLSDAIATLSTATTAAIAAAIANLVNSAPGALDTLKELADAMGDDPNFAATMTNALTGKVNITDIVNTLTQTAANTVLDGRQGKVLSDLIAALTATVSTLSLGVLGLNRTNILGEYRFDEGSGTVLKDYSGNGNDGDYVGAPTFLVTGGFTPSGGTKYARGNPAMWLNMKTLYVAFEMTSAITSFQGVIGNANAITSTFELLTAPNTSGVARFAQVYNSGNTFVGLTRVCIMAITIETTPKLYLNGLLGNTAITDLTGKTTGTPWFGNGSLGHYFSGNIHYVATYGGTIHTPEQIRSNTAYIKAILQKRGVEVDNQSAYASTTGHVLLTDGDSITAGQGSTGNNTGWATKLLLNEAFNIRNVGFSGITAANSLYFTDNYAQLYSPAFNYRKIVTVALGTNDISGSITGIDVSTCIDNIQQKCLGYRARGWKVVLISLIARGATPSVGIKDLNAKLRASWRQFADEFADVAADPKLGADGANLNTTYFNADTIHPNDTGHTIMAKHISAAVNRLLSRGASSNAVFSQVAPVTVANTLTETSVAGISAAHMGHWDNAQFSAATTSASPTLTNVGQAGAVVAIGQSITGAGIPAGTTVLAIPNNTSITMSANATATATNILVQTGKIGIRACFFTPSKSVRITQRGFMSTTGTPNLTRNIKIGATVIGTTGAVAMPANLTNAAYKMELDISCVTGGDAATFYVQGTFTVGGIVYPMMNASTVSFDSTIDNIFDITDTWGTASAGNSDTSTNLVIDQVYV